MFGTILRQARTKAGLTQKQVAAKTDTSYQYISKLERGEKPCSLDTLRRLDSVFHFPTRTLVQLIRCAGTEIKP